MADLPKASVRLNSNFETICRDATSYTNQISSPLLRLPGELRNIICQYALSDWTVCLQEDPSAPGGRRKVYCRRNPWYLYSRARFPATSAILNLPSTCRQLRAETIHLPFTLNNEFEIAEEQKGVIRNTMVYCRENRKFMSYWWFERRRLFRAFMRYDYYMSRFHDSD